MPQMVPQQLQAKAEQFYRRQLTDLVTKAKLRFETGPNSTEWDPIQHRYLFQQAVIVWREFDNLEIKVAPDGRILAFSDKNRLSPAGPPPTQRLTEADLLQIAATTGKLGGNAWIVKPVVVAEGLLQVLVHQLGGGVDPKLQFKINQTTRQVAAFVVVEEAEA